MRVAADAMSAEPGLQAGAGLWLTKMPRGI